MSLNNGDPVKDSVLETFTKAANKHDFSLDITLNMKGALITGTLISAQEYFQSLSEKFVNGNDISEQISEMFNHASQNIQESENLNYIHLKNTRIYCGDNKPTPSNSEFLWRGRLDQTDGFFIGKIAEEK
ncbi:gas vesicle accessory protein GvpU [Metabacillus arenae]|uniref:Gas vesicle protein GvpU n=1 Tax=Metabacillus arenae TaxID=2771434 RepID=A0A926S0M6_9BACI|nr:gas vesicle accessory protein GvpU [Metabacillus arenae]MBD1380164.1 gas vesicle protein GvpU [Metabacillus arenae]